MTGGPARGGISRLEVWSVTGSQHLYGEAVLERVADRAGQIAAFLDDARELPVRIVFKPVVTTPESIAGVLRDADHAPDCIGVQSAHGDREFAFIQTRLRRDRKSVVGYWQDPAVLTRLGRWARAAAGWHEAQHLINAATTMPAFKRDLRSNQAYYSIDRGL